MSERLIENTREPVRHPWPADCEIQGGACGVVFREGSPYQTAFVEAFAGGTFLRGEGKTVADAEDACWAKYQQLTTCPHDQGFDRRHYVNGSGYCRRCGTWFPGRVTGFEPLPEYYAPSERPSLIERAFAGDMDAAAEILTTVAGASQLPKARPSEPPPAP